MRLPKATAFLFILVIAAGPAATAQLRNHSPYDHDGIQREQTGFVLHEGGRAEFTWASYWTQTTAQSFPDQAALFVWHFADGTKAYSRQGELIGDLGRLTGYLVSQQGPELEDRDRRKIQPLSETNVPTRVELWIGEAGETTGYVPKVQGDHACFGAASIEVGRLYHFTECPE